MVTATSPKIDQDRLLRIIESELQDLPPLPAVVIRIMQTINEPSTSAVDLNRLISSDQALSAKILRLVNSSYYGFPKRIATITNAIVILGFNTIRNLATAVGVTKAFEANSKSALNRDMFWAHSVGTAVCAWTIARKRDLSPKVTEEVFVGGLLHDIGKLFIDQYFPEQYAVAIALSKSENISIWEAEKKALGIGHSLVGKRVGEAWNLPPTMIAMIAQHHQPAYANDQFDMVAITHAADRLARKLGLGNGGDQIVPDLAPEVEKWLSFSPQAWEQIEADSLRKYEDAKEFMRITIS